MNIFKELTTGNIIKRNAVCFVCAAEKLPKKQRVDTVNHSGIEIAYCFPCYAKEVN